MSSQQKLMRDVEAHIAEGRLFHAQGAATEIARSPDKVRRTCVTFRDIDRDKLVSNVLFSTNIWLHQGRKVRRGELSNVMSMC